MNQASIEGMSRHTLIVGNAPPFHGSTALAMTIMSDSNVGTFCAHVGWECELNPERLGIRNATTAAIMSLLWRPSVHTVFSKWIETPLSTSVQSVLGMKGISPRVNIVTMFQPPCLYLLSHNQRNSFQKNASNWAKGSAHHWAQARMAIHQSNSLILSYGDLLWDFPTVAESLRRRFGLNVSNRFSPRMGIDVFPYNKWKTDGTLADYARTHDPGSFGYDVRTMRCHTWFMTRFDASAQRNLDALIGQAMAERHSSIESRNR